MAPLAHARKGENIINEKYISNNEQKTIKWLERKELSVAKIHSKDSRHKC